MNSLIVLFKMEDFINSLNIFWKGMLALFIAMLIISLAIFILNKATKPRNKK